VQSALRRNNNRMNGSLTRRAVAEAIGTYAIVFFGCGAIALFARTPSAISVAAIPVVFGLVVAAMVYGFGHVSGAHFNPAVTLAFAAARHFPFREVLSYWLGQLCGAVLGAVTLYYLFPAGATYGATVPHVATLQVLFWEFMMTFFLMVVIMAVATDTRAVGTMAGAAIGAVVMIEAFVGGWATGASMNPARSFGPALVEGTMDTMWIYLVAPIAGALAGALVYKWVSQRVESSKNP
jgi:MIP family channel proteins